MKLGKSKDSRTRRKPKTEDAEIKVLQKLLDEKQQPSFKEYLLKKGYSLKTIKSFETVVKRYQKWLSKENIAETAVIYTDILHYVQGLRKRLTQHSIQTEINSINHYYKYLVQIGLVKENPTTQIQIKGVKRKKLHHVFTKQELEKLYNDYKELPPITGNYELWKLSRKRNEIILSLLIYQGLNSEEINRIKLADVKLREGKVYINGSRRSNERTLSLESHQILDMMEYNLQTRQKLLEITGKQTDLLFISTGKASSNNLRAVISKLIKQLKKFNILPT